MGITFEQLTYRYKEQGVASKWALDHIDLTLQRNQFITILGAPGSGKSTLLQHLNGLIRADHGTIHILDMLLAPAPAKMPKRLTQRVGLVFQYPELQLFSNTIWDDLLYGPLNFELTKSDAELAAAKAAQDMGIDETILQKSPYQLSSGQLRKAAIASVLAAKPEVIILDEPTASLDATSRLELMQLLHRQCREQNRTVIVVTHSIEEIMPYTDQMVVMGDGKVLYSGAPLDLMKRKDVLNSAGLQVPAAYHIFDALREPLGLGELEHYLSAAELASIIKEALT